MASRKRKRRADIVGEPQGMSPIGTARKSLRPSEGGGGLAITKGACGLQSAFITKLWGNFICRSKPDTLSYGVSHGRRPMVRESNHKASE